MRRRGFLGVLLASSAAAVIPAVPDDRLVDVEELKRLVSDPSVPIEPKPESVTVDFETFQPGDFCTVTFCYAFNTGKAPPWRPQVYIKEVKRVT